MVQAQQQTLFPDEVVDENRNSLARSRRSGTFVDNMRLPIHRWFRYSAGFSAEWAAGQIQRHKGKSEGYVLDPFAGSGTTILAAESQGVPSLGIENHPFVCRIAQAKLGWTTDALQLLTKAEKLMRLAKDCVESEPASKATLLHKCYEPDQLAQLEALRDTYLRHFADGSDDGELLWLAITSILRECSGAGTAQWQYVLPRNRKAKVKSPFPAFIDRTKTFVRDILQVQSAGYISNGAINLGDARSIEGLEELRGRISLVITSPPYPNNYDYADATRLEMTFWGEVSSWSDLQAAVRYRLIHSCSQHTAAEHLRLDDLLSKPEVRPIRSELEDVCRQLGVLREQRAGRKTYHTMVAAYFVDLAKSWVVLRALCREGARVCFIIGDAAPYGVYVPAERWLGELAVAAGFGSYTFEKIRDRNIKWKNRKHRVPLKEGNLWVEA